MAIVFVNAGAPSTQTAGNPNVPPLPASIAKDDILVCPVTIGDTVNSNALAPAFNLNDGSWTIEQVIDNGTQHRFAVAWRRVGSGTEVSPSIQGQYNDSTAQIFAYRGCVKTGNPFAASKSIQVNANGTLVTAGAITPSVPNCMILFTGCRTNGGATNASFSTFSGTNPTFTSAGQVALNGAVFNIAQFLAHGLKSDATSTGNRTCTASQGGDNSAAMLALIPEVDPGIAAAANDVAAASAAMSTQIKAGANATAQSAMTAALSTGKPVAANAADAVSVVGALTTAIRLAASAVNAVAASGGLSTGAVMQAAAQDVVSAVAALTTQSLVRAAAVDAVSATGALTNWSTVTLGSDLYTGQGGALDPNFWIDEAPTTGTILYYDGTHITIYPNGEVSSDVTDCSAVVQFFKGGQWYTGTLVFTSGLAAIGRSEASSAAQLSSAIQLAAAAQALATAAGAFSTGAGLNAAATDTAAATGTMTTGKPLSALAVDVSTAVAALVSQIKLVADASGRVQANAELNGVISLAAAAAGIAASTGALTTGIQTAALAPVIASAFGSLTNGVRLDGAARDVVLAAGSLATAIAMGGAANNAAFATGDLTTVKPLFAAAIDAATMVATVATGIRLNAVAQTLAAAGAALSSAVDLFCDAQSEATATAVLSDVIADPPVGQYVIDPRYVVSPLVSRDQTPRLPAKYADETVIVTFDLSAALPEGVTFKGPISWQIAALAGEDANVGTMKFGIPTYDASKRKIVQAVTGGLPGCKYYLKAAAATSQSPQVVALAAILEVR